MPLGAGALAGTTFPINREMVAEELGFKQLYENSMDAVSDRDFVVEFLANASLLMTHLSRLSEDLILWNSQEFGFVELDDAFTTGSSIMPQKKNPDVAELVRGKTGRVYGHLLALLTVLKGLPLSYNKDLQEDKEGLFDTADTIKMSLTLYAAMLRTLRVNREKMYAAAAGDFASATDLADYLVRKGLPFREAHAVVGRLVAWCIAEKRSLPELTVSELQVHSPLFTEEALPLLTPEAVVAARASRGGTAAAAVAEQLQKAKQALAE
jgi:argininosuccinate lyase